MFALVGPYFASSMIGKDLAVGLAAGCLGLLIGTIGPAPAAANFRFTFGQAYLLDGLSLTIVALGLFAVPEIVSMLSGGGGISQKKQVVSNWSSGFVEFWKHRWLVIRSALIGTFGGFVPAVGANASTWVAYGHSMSSTKDKSRFGKGEPRGIAAAEGANNATVISDLVPTLLFSVPGGPAAAIFLGALFSFGFYPGPRMVTEEPVLLYLIVWSVALASIVGAAICFAITPMVAQLTRTRFALIAAPLMLVMIAGAYQATQSMGDIAMLLLLGVIGWVMKQADWPRAPVLVGFVLAKPVEQYFWLTTQIHGWTWLARPGVLLIASLILLPLLWRGFKAWKARQASLADSAEAPSAPDALQPVGTSATRLAMAALAVVIFGYALIEAIGFRANAMLLPLLAITPGLALAVFVALREGLRFARHRDLFHIEARADYPIIALLVGYATAIGLIGFTAATVVFLLVVLLKFAGMRALGGVAYGAVLLAGSLGLFAMMRITPPEGLLAALIP